MTVPPVGLILFADRNAAVAHYALDGLPNNILAAEYRVALPKAKELERQMNLVRASHESLNKPWKE